MSTLWGETFPRLEQFIRDCPAYESDVWHRVMVLCLYNGWHTCVFLLVIAYYDRSAFHLAVASGVMFTKAVLWAAEAYMDPFQVRDVVCRTPGVAPTTWVWAQLPWSVAAVVYVVTVFGMYDMLVEDGNSCTDAARISFMCLLLGTTCLSEVYLQLHDVMEVLTSVALGLFSGMVVAGVIIVVLRPAFRGRHDSWVKGLFQIKADSFR